MDPTTVANLVNLGCGGAVIATVMCFLRHLRESSRQDRAEREAERASLMSLIENDLSHVTTGLEKVNDGLSKVVTELRGLHRG